MEAEVLLYGTHCGFICISEHIVQAGQKTIYKKLPDAFPKTFQRSRTMDLDEFGGGMKKQTQKKTARDG